MSAFNETDDTEKCLLMMKLRSNITSVKEQGEKEKRKYLKRIAKELGDC